MEVRPFEYSKENVAAIIALEKNALPAGWQYEDAEEYYAGVLQDPENISIGLWSEKGELAGYLLAVPHNTIFNDREMFGADPGLVSDPNRYYVETMEIAETYRRSVSGGRFFLQMLEELFKQAERRFGIHLFSTHARVKNSLSNALQKTFGPAITKVRRIDQWPSYKSEEPTEYIEMDTRLRPPR